VILGEHEADRRMTAPEKSTTSRWSAIKGLLRIG
jgi:hypothetical protein